jgi:hypothetical protein
MLTGQRIRSALGMIEIPQEPPASVMAILTLRSKRLLVFIDLDMATVAILFCISETQSGMAFLACGQQMQPGKRKSRLIMVETLTLPTAVRMTTFALGSQLCLVFVVLSMAAETL